MYRQVENNEIISADDDANGRFVCSVDMETYEGRFFNFLEIAKGCTWDHKLDTRKIIFRVSSFTNTRGVQLGNCAILNKEQVANAIALLQQLHEEM